MQATGNSWFQRLCGPSEPDPMESAISGEPRTVIATEPTRWQKVCNLIQKLAGFVLGLVALIATAEALALLAGGTAVLLAPVLAPAVAAIGATALGLLVLLAAILSVGASCYFNECLCARKKLSVVPQQTYVPPPLPPPASSQAQV